MNAVLQSLKIKRTDIQKKIKIGVSVIAVDPRNLNFLIVIIFVKWKFSQRMDCQIFEILKNVNSFETILEIYEITV